MRYIFAVSDATGDTCLRVAKAALSQFKTTKVVLEKVPHIRSYDDIKELMNRVVKVDGIIIYTMVSPGGRQHITNLGRQNGVPTVDILGPVLSRFSDLLESVTEGPLPFSAGDFLPFGKSWNTSKNYTGGKGFSRWIAELPEIVLGTAIEVPYANADGAEVNQESARAFGIDLGRGLTEYLCGLD